MHARQRLAVMGLVMLGALAGGRADITFTEDFGTENTFLRWGPEYGSRGWYCPGDEANALIAATNIPVPGMSGAVAYVTYDSRYQADGLRPLPEGATNLWKFKRIEMEITLCQTNATYGGGLFLVSDAYFVNVDWYGSPVKYLNYPSMLTNWFGVFYEWHSYEAGVTVATPLLVAYTNNVSYPVATGIRSTCLDPNKTYRCRISFDLVLNKMKLEQKEFDSVSATWGSWSTAVDWVAAGCNLSAMNINAMMIRSYNVTPHATYTTYLDDFSFLAVSLPSGMIVSVR